MDKLKELEARHSELKAEAEKFVDILGLNGSKGDRPEETTGGLRLTPLSELLNEPEETCSWLVQDRLPSGGFSLLAGKPKGGKSTLARCLALAVAQGRPWLGFETQKGAVFYLALEEKRSEVKKHFQVMGAKPDDPVSVFCGASPQDGLAQLRQATEREKPVLIVIDPLGRFVRVRDLNDYAGVTAALEPILILARESGAHILMVHHTGKGERAGGDSILGSTALFGAVDTALILKRAGNFRTLSSFQRYGTDLEEITLMMDEETRSINAGLSKREADEEEAGGAIMEFLKGQTDLLEEKTIMEGVEGRKGLKVKALRRLVEKGEAVRSGKGGKGDPFKYSCSLVPSILREQENKIPESDISPQKIENYSCSRKNINIEGLREQEIHEEEIDLEADQ